MFKCLNKKYAKIVHIEGYIWYKIVKFEYYIFKQEGICLFF